MVQAAATAWSVAGWYMPVSMLVSISCAKQVQLRVLATLLTEMDGVETAKDVVCGIN